MALYLILDIKLFLGINRMDIKCNKCVSSIKISIISLINFYNFSPNNVFIIKNTLYNKAKKKN